MSSEDSSGEVAASSGGSTAALDVLADAAEQDRLTMVQQEEIHQNIAATQKLVGEIESPSVLLEEYKDNPEKGFLLGVEDLVQRYGHIRRIRGDGNCFYRAFLYAYLESLVKGRLAGGEAAKAADALWKDLLERIRASKDWLVGVGYEDIAISTFWEVFVEELESLPDKTVEELESTFNQTDGTSNYMVWWCRLMTAGFLKLNREVYEPFIYDAAGAAVDGVDGFCQREVEPMGRECEQIHIMALTQALGVGVKIEYLDGRHFRGQLDQITLPEGATAKVKLLYRPGHYDILIA